MKIKFFCPRWGSENLQWDEFAHKVRAAGYDGIESPIPFEEKEKLEIKEALKSEGLELIGQYYQSFEEEFGAHKDNFKRHLESIAELKPILIVSQTGKDYFSAAQNKNLFQAASEISNNTGITISHETHRNKALFAAHIAKNLLQENQEVRITADFSHWCVVSESLLEQQKDAVNLAISRTIHIHARVGQPESPQVGDPRSPEWKIAFEAHLKWWDQIVKERFEAVADFLTITPEFGPEPYMQTIPFSGMPVANQWDINIYMMNFLKKRYAEFL
ncbi:TIM barrel protein [Flavobacterium sp. GSB-24]|uniref:sugar phosphate isomerase/epimerase family protein n=1 Tax=Flavobacterium sp. GSB-24 TaxID=2994319 RepID=UPI0024909D26|nr:TIM barrel protein [Flavobacterium sp. GSB-24]BDU25763.1 hypothetical protein FLGSB24_25070 [Flavobacterium sp. GSB-24]